MIKINNIPAEISFLFMEFASSHAPIAFNICFLDFSRYYSNTIIFLNNSRLYFDGNRLTKISLPFIVISNGIAHPLVLLETDFENSVILDSISKIKNYQNNIERSKIEILQTKVFWNLESKHASPNDVIS